jgi:hypothetical protein
MTGASSDHLGFQNGFHVHGAPVARRLACHWLHIGREVDKFAGALRAPRAKSGDHHHFPVGHIGLKTSDGAYELPFGPGKSFLNSNSLLNRTLLGGWQVNGIFVGQPGLPFTATTSGTATKTGASASRANVVPGVPRYPAKKSVNQWFNPAAFAVPTAYNWGNSGRNILRGPDEINLDSSAEKKFPITEGATLLFRVEFFNMFNHPQFQIPATNTTRQMQFTLRLSF